MNWFSPSAVALIVSNLVPLYGVFVWGWSILALLVLFWLETILVGLLGALRMLIARTREGPYSLGKVFWVPAFLILFGLLSAGLGVMMYVFFGPLEGELLFDTGLLPIRQTARILEKQGLGLALAALCASHLFSFFRNYLAQGEFRHATLQDLMWEANSRVFMFFFSLFFGALFMKVGSAVWGLAFLVGFKTWFDLATHLKARRTAAAA